MIKREKLAEGAYFTSVEAPYKRVRLSVFLSAPLSRGNQTETALLPFMLERGTRKLPDKTLLSRRLLSLYGSDMQSDYSQFGLSRVISAYIAGADGALLPQGGAVAKERAELLSELLFDTNAPGGAFEENGLAVEKEKLREAIRSIINSKRDYCFRKLTEAFYRDDLRALPTDGFEEDLDLIKGKSLFEAYEEYLRRCSIEIIYAGSDPASMRGAAESFISSAGAREKTENKPLTAVPVSKTEIITEELDIEQDKLALAYTTGEALTREEMYALRFGCALLGGTPTSRLFVNVREKQSLCYYVSCSASQESAGGAFVECGVDSANSQRTLEAINKELRLLVEKGPSDKEMQETALSFKNAFGSVRDSSSLINNYLFSTIQRFGGIVLPEEQTASFLSVSKEDVQRVMAKLQLNTVSRLKSKKGA